MIKWRDSVAATIAYMKKIEVIKADLKTSATREEEVEAWEHLVLGNNLSNEFLQKIIKSKRMRGTHYSRLP